MVTKDTKEDSDSDYIQPTSVSETDVSDTEDSETDSHDTAETDDDDTFDAEFTEEEITEIILDIYSLMDEYIETNILELSSPSFYENMFIYVSETIAVQWEDIVDIPENTILEFIRDVYSVYADFSAIPPRSRSTTPANDSPPTAATITELQNTPQPAQRTAEWYEFRNGLISASNAWKVFGSESLRNNIIYEKCKPVDADDSVKWVNVNSPMHWGVKYEPISIMIYEKMNATKISEFGCIRHKKYPFIGASPDGIITDKTNPRFGRMLEIKNIVNREITGIPKPEYWIQTQLQMETCDLEECDFFETRFLEYSEEAFYAYDTHEYRGVFLYFIKTGDSIPIYIYMPLDLPLDKASIRQWKTATIEEMGAKQIIYICTLYWHLDEYSCVLIDRNRKWFNAALPRLQEIWKIIETERETGEYEHRAAKKRTENARKIYVHHENASYIFDNMPASNSICLVKLDS
jgi:putative phage-type endonuclease